MKPNRQRGLAIAATLGAVALVPSVPAAATDTVAPGAAVPDPAVPEPVIPEPGAPVDGDPDVCATPSSATTSTTTTSPPTTTPTPSSVPAPSEAGDGDRVEGAEAPVESADGPPEVSTPPATTPAPVTTVAEPVLTEPCEPGATTTTVAPTETATTLPVPTLPPPATVPAEVPAPAVEIPAINAPATPSESLPERESTEPIEATGAEVPSQPAVQATAPVEPTAPLPPVNSTWTGAGVARPSAPRAPGTTSLQLGRTPAGERVVLVDDVEVILETIRQLESAERYHIGPNQARASGAYQFIPSTWNNYGGYAEAYLAPPAVQDERARADVMRFLTMYGGDVSMVPIMWYYPRAALDPSWMDRVPNPAGGNRLTIREYQTRWLQRLASNATEMLGTYVPGPTSPAAVTVLSEVPVHGQAPDDGSVVDPAGLGAPVLVPASTPAPPATTATPAPPAATEPAIADPVTSPATTAVAAPPIDVDVVTVSDSTMDLAARSVPPEIEGDDGLGSMRTIVFPVLGPVAYADGWGDARSGGRLHEGTDIIGVRMQPILAVVDGVISRYQPTSTGIRGVAITVADQDGWRYNYFHNNDDTPGTDDGQASEEFRLAPGLAIGDTVAAGQIIGYMGDSGNAEESVAHLHFELRDPTGRSHPSYWSLQAAEARQACTIGIGPWSTPTIDGEAVTANVSIDAAVPAIPAADAGAVADPAATDVAAEVADPIVEHTVVTPLFGEGQWVIDSDGRVTATGDAALIMPRRDLQCDVGPATPFGTDSAGWGEVTADALDGTVLAGADLTNTILDDIVPDVFVDPLLTLTAGGAPEGTPLDPSAVTAVADAGAVVDVASTAAETVEPTRTAGAVVVDGGRVTVDGESLVDDPISRPMMFTDPATGETIIVVFELPAAPPDFRLERLS